MPKISMKELEKFMRDNPNKLATQAIKEQLRVTAPISPNTSNSSDVVSESAQIRNTASDLAAEKINKLHEEVLHGFIDMCHKAIQIGKLLFEQKMALGHGQWFDWIDNKLDIGPRQIENYMKIYHERERVLESMKNQIKAGLKPSIRKMLLAATTKDNQSPSDYEEKCQKTGSRMTPKQKNEQRKDEKRENEILSLAKMYIANEINDNSLRALVLKWNRENADNYELFVEDVIEQVKQIEESNPETPDHQPSGRTNIMLSIDADLWDSFVHFGGREAFLSDYIHDFVEKYVIEQKSFRIAN